MIALVIDNYFKSDTQPDTILDSFCIISHMDTYLHYLQYNLTHEQVSSVSSVSAAKFDNKLPNISVNRLPYGLFTLRLQNNSSVQDICLYRCVTAYRVIL